MKTRRGDFVTFSEAGMREFELLAKAHKKKSKKLQKAHQKEVDLIVATFQLMDIAKDIKIQDQAASADAKRTLVVQIGALNSKFDDYFYRLQGTKDITINDLQNILLCSPFGWQVGTDYIIENNVIKISSKVKVK